MEKYEELRNRVRQMFSERVGEEVLDEDYTVGDFTVAFITKDANDDLWFYTYDPTGDGIPSYEDNRFYFEHAAMRWLKENKPEDCAVHFGHVQANILDAVSERAYAFVAVQRYC